MARKVIHGSGITARVHTTIESAADGREWSKSWNDAIREGGGIFGAVSLGAVDICEQILAATTAGDDPPVEDSPESFARRILRQIHLAKVAIDRGSADLAARNAWDAGVQWAMARMKWQWEVHALRGEKIATAAAEGARATNAPKRLMGAKRMARMAELVASGKLPSNAAQQCASELGGSAEYLRQKWSTSKGKV